MSGATTAALLGRLSQIQASNQSGDVAAKLEAFVAKHDDIAAVRENHPEFLPNLLAVTSDYVTAMGKQGIEVPAYVTQWRKAVLLELEDQLPKKRWRKLSQYGKALLPTQAAMRRAKQSDPAEHKRLSVQVMAMHMLAMPSDARRLDMDSKDIEDVQVHKMHFVDDEGMAQLQATLGKLQKLAAEVRPMTADLDEVRDAESAIMKTVNAKAEAARTGDAKVGTVSYGAGQSVKIASVTGGPPSIFTIRSSAIGEDLPDS